MSKLCHSKVKSLTHGQSVRGIACIWVEAFWLQNFASYLLFSTLFCLRLVGRGEQRRKACAENIKCGKHFGLCWTLDIVPLKLAKWQFRHCKSESNFLFRVEESWIRCRYCNHVTLNKSLTLCLTPLFFWLECLLGIFGYIECESYLKGRFSMKSGKLI